MEQPIAQVTRVEGQTCESSQDKSSLSVSSLSHEGRRCGCVSDESLLSKSDVQSNGKERKENEVCIQKKVYGIVKWYNVKYRYGFIKRLDTNADVFVHKNGIKLSTPNKVKSVADGEIVQFDIYQAEKGPEARNVTGPEGKPARASKYARAIRRFVSIKYVPRQPTKKTKDSKKEISTPPPIMSKECQSCSPVRAEKTISGGSCSHETGSHKKRHDENCSSKTSTNKESGYESKEDKASSASVVKPSQNASRKNHYKKIIYIVKGKRAGDDHPVLQPAPSCTCNRNH